MKKLPKSIILRQDNQRMQGVSACLQSGSYRDCDNAFYASLAVSGSLLLNRKKHPGDVVKT
ncbi:hypothetical protein [Thiolapillus sp.]|uniref:hypothetical protein n=1 Tax=Thiolapillus sp. TaxID=2017437 RepID=UPI003AF57124